MAKKERDGRVTVQRRVARGDENPSHVASFYPKGTPTDESGLAESNVNLDRKRVREIGALDAKSARVMKQSRLTLARKAKGEWVKWNDEDDAVRFWECSQVWTECMIRVNRVAPTPDNSIPVMPISMFEGDYGSFVRRIREMHWDGRSSATYIWKCYDRTHPQLATGQINFAERAEEDMNNRNPHGGYPQQQFGYGPQFGGGGMYGGGMPNGGMPFNPWGGGFPPQQQFPQQQQMPMGQMGAPIEQHPPQQQPMPPPVAPAPVAPAQGGADTNLVQMCMYLAAQLSQAQQQIAWLQQQMIQQQAPQVHPSTQPKQEVQEKPPQTPVQVLKENVETMKQVVSVTKSISDMFEGDAPDPTPEKTEDPFPIQVKEINGINFLAESGEVVRDFWPNALANSGKAFALGSTFFDKIAGIVTKASEVNQKKDTEREDALKRARELAEIDKQRAESYERAAKARREIEEANARSGPAQVVVVEHAPVPSAEPVPEPFPIQETSPDQSTPPPNGAE